VRCALLSWVAMATIDSRTIFSTYFVVFFILKYYSGKGHAKSKFTVSYIPCYCSIFHLFVSGVGMQEKEEAEYHRTRCVELEKNQDS
jgi:hypothetical protein